MKYGHIQGIDKPISRIFLGTANIPKNIDTSEWINSIIETGVNSLDTARVYPNSELTIGKWLSESGMRENVVILSKCCHPKGPFKRVNAKAIKSDIKSSLKALHTDYIDIYLTHRDDPNTDAGEIVEGFNELKASGMIKVFGVSNWTHNRIDEANEYAYKNGLIPFSVSSPSFSLANQIGVFGDKTCVSISGPSHIDAREWYKSNQFPILAYAPLGHGILSGKLSSSKTNKIDHYLDRFAIKGYACEENYERLKRCEFLAKEKDVTVPQIALAWLFCQKMNLFTVVSTSNAKRMIDNSRSLELLLTNEECMYLDLEIS